LPPSAGFFPTWLKSNRLVNPDKKEDRLIREVDISPRGRVVHLKGFGFVKFFGWSLEAGTRKYWATNDMKMTEEKRKATIIREAVRRYLAHPLYVLHPTA
jgi:hypothetical protein